VLLAQPNLNPPVIAPEDFSGMVGAYSITASVDRTDVAVEDPIVLTLRIRGNGPPAHQPKRSKLRVLPDEFKSAFFIDELPEKDSFDAMDRTWSFVYRLRPKDLHAKEIPSLKLVYYSFQKMFQTSFSDPITLTVKPRPEATIATQPMKRPQQVRQVNASPTTLRGELPFVPPLWIVGVALAVPPLLCLGAYRIFRRQRPASVQRRRRVRNRAAQQLLKQLRTGMEPASDIFTRYLQVRLELTINDPTPTEVASFLRQRDVPRELRQRCTALYEACGERFAPHVANISRSQQNEVEQLILALEGCVR